MRFSSLTLLLCLQFFATALFAQRPEAIPGDLLIMVHEGASAQDIVADLDRVNGKRTGIRVVDEVSVPMRTWLLRFDPTHVEQAVMLRAVRNHPAVQLAQNNHQLKQRAVPNDANYGQQWHHENINSEAAWDISTGGLTADGDTIVVCIIENCDLPHPDLIANAWFNHAEIPNNDIDDDGNGYVDDHRGWNPTAGNDQVYGGGHGTEVAGMIGATGNNSIGMVGANWAVKMMVVVNSGASDAGVIASHTYPLVMRRLYNESNGARGAFVVATNASWGIDGGQPEDAPLWCAMYDTLGTAGVLNCGATANNAVNVDVVGDLPTACPSDFMISVTATDINDIRDFSAFGLTTIDVGAPGDNVFTTAIGGGYGSTSGTSFASPLTAGVIGLLYSAPCATMMTLVKNDPEAGALFIREKLFDGVDQVGNLPDNTVTGGRINAGTSMELIMSTCGSCPAPYNSAAQAVDINTAMVSWSAVVGTLFELRYRPAGGATWTEVAGIGTLAYTISDIETCTPYEFQVRVLCGEETSEYSNLYTWTTEGCCTIPTGLAQANANENSIGITWNELLAAGSYDVQYTPVSGGDMTTLNGLATTSAALTQLEACANYLVQVRATCNGNSTDWSAPTTVATTGCGACVDNTYCANLGGNTEDEWIESVQLGTIDHESGDDEGYGDYTSISTELEMGMDHTMTLTPGYDGFEFSEWFGVWIDLDQNGMLDAIEELVFATDESDNGPVFGVINIPTTAAPGPTRMRIVMKYNTALSDPCSEDFDYGEVEDYCVNLVANPGSNVAELGTGTHQLYPQPADAQFFIRFANDGHTSALMEVFDATGKRMATTSLWGSTGTFPTTDLADGLYTYRLSDFGGNELGKGRFMVMHAR